MIIKTIAETSYDGMYKVAPEEGSAFYIRQEYLPGVKIESLETGFELNEEMTDLFLDAGLACVVELKAVDYLARAEQSRFGLAKKLAAKQFEKKYINMALDVLELKNYLSDERFARAWLNIRKINHYEGYSRLVSELQSRGISREIAETAVNDFFSENDENDICLKAYKKMVKRGKEGDKLAAAMLQAGFSFKQIKAAKELFESEKSI